MKIKVAIKSGRSSSLAALHSLKAFLRDAPDFCSGEPGSTPGGGTLLSGNGSLSKNGQLRLQLRRLRKVEVEVKMEMDIT